MSTGYDPVIRVGLHRRSVCWDSTSRLSGGQGAWSLFFCIRAWGGVVGGRGPVCYTVDFIRYQPRSVNEFDYQLTSERAV